MKLIIQMPCYSEAGTLALGNSFLGSEPNDPHY